MGVRSPQNLKNHKSDLECDEDITTFKFEPEIEPRLFALVSENANISYGVPQGGVLGPSLFLMYINESMQYDYKQ